MACPFNPLLSKPTAHSPVTHCSESRLAILGARPPQKIFAFGQSTIRPVYVQLAALVSSLPPGPSTLKQLLSVTSLTRLFRARGATNRAAATMNGLTQQQSATSAFRTKAQTLSLVASSSTASPSPRRAETVASASASTRSRTGAKNKTSGRRQESQKIEAATFPATLQQAEPMSAPEHFGGSFEDLVRDSEAVLVDFYAPWCGPCQLMSRVVAKLSKEMQGSLKVVKVNTDNYPKLASKYRIQALPTCLLFRDGVLIDRVDGFMAEHSFGKRVRFYVSRLDKKFGRR